MCGRFTFTIRDIVDAARAFEALVAPEDAAAYPLEHRPTDSHWNIRLDHAGERRMIPARFGFARVDGQQVINARSETAGVLPTFRRAFTQSRCLVPADGFYEWRGDRGGRRPIWFHDPAEAYLARAGLALENAGSLSFVILTVPANQLIVPFTIGCRFCSRNRARRPGSHEAALTY